MVLVKVNKIVILVISGWQQHDVSKTQKPGNDFVAMNKLGAKKGCVDSKVDFWFIFSNLEALGRIMKLSRK